VRPLIGAFGIGGCLVRVGIRLGTIQDADRVGFELDDKLLDRVLDGLFAIRHFDRAVVLASDEFALHVDEAAFDEALSGFAKRISKCELRAIAFCLASRRCRPSRTS
jgi:hypothetical protein